MTKPLKTKDATPKQEKLIRLLQENLGKTGDGVMTLEQMLIEAGYSESTAKKSARVIVNSVSVQEAIDPFVKELDDKRRLAIKHITEKKLRGSSAYTNALVADLMTKNHQLLTGKPTQRTDALDEEEKKKIDAIFKRNNK